jgi:hypothetical protein
MKAPSTLQTLFIHIFSHALRIVDSVRLLLSESYVLYFIVLKLKYHVYHNRAWKRFSFQLFYFPFSIPVLFFSLLSWISCLLPKKKGKKNIFPCWKAKKCVKNLNEQHHWFWCQKFLIIPRYADLRALSKAVFFVAENVVHIKSFIRCIVKVSF